MFLFFDYNRKIICFILSSIGCYNIFSALLPPCSYFSAQSSLTVCGFSQAHGLLCASQFGSEARSRGEPSPCGSFSCRRHAISKRSFVVLVSTPPGMPLASTAGADTSLPPLPPPPSFSRHVAACARGERRGARCAPIVDHVVVVVLCDPVATRCDPFTTPRVLARGCG